jgi:hypothetical protein
MITLKDYAKKKKISLKMARMQLEKKMEEGVMARKRGPANMFLYYDVIPMTVRWHDPFNRCKQYEMARPIPKMQAEDAQWQAGQEVAHDAEATVDS